MIRRLRRWGHAPGAISPEDQVVVDQFHAMSPPCATPSPGRRAPAMEAYRLRSARGVGRYSSKGHLWCKSECP